MWETEVPLVLKGEYDPNFTAEMMAKDISLGLDLAKRYGVPQPFNEQVLC
jgi:3-hydroxyisobutyrate dehydrogenase-like beta-hydroxyacid dehydrogenase